MSNFPLLVWSQFAVGVIISMLWIYAFAKDCKRIDLPIERVERFAWLVFMVLIVIALWPLAATGAFIADRDEKL